MCIQLASLGPGTCFKMTPHFSNSRKTKFVSAAENLERTNTIRGQNVDKQAKIKTVYYINKDR